ncbi:penicillin-insensitive murein endopeptidase [Marilutibacter alkalisoli]|uniref:Penicillin-insensitive murein endopeptidase n=1 Tax=Marilutibacter alkalisoli TaxID=2591633 RepID=A0A514BPL3_9GAMM|nr:penicillin-insensitive murein endopeptidase [Lysobacter alkalisoli]QDH69313.1 penicillin-insensitive murein endopeptidase [Lysobacter alkalisoli]
MRTPARLAIGLLTALYANGAWAADSICHGTPSNGRLEHGVALPTSGSNFRPYSRLGVTLGRTHVHARVERAVTAAYAVLARSTPDVVYVYGETGWPRGGRFKPHRTHQNGLSVDFMVPVRDTAGRSVPLPTDPGNKYGYAIEFDAQGRFGDLRIDFEAISEHLRRLHEAARAQGIGIERVIFDPAYLPRLHATTHGAYLRRNIRFMQRQAWVRHDEHYHADFTTPCQPMPN